MQTMLFSNRDRKYPDEFDGFWKPDVPCTRIPPKATNANSFVESFITTTECETLNHFICFSRGHLDHIVRVWLQHYNWRRPH